MTPPLIFTFFTEGAYRRECEQLTQSAQALGLSVTAWSYNHLRSWHDAVCWKPQAILMALEGLPRFSDQGLLWVDADARFRAVPDWSLLSGAEFGGHHFRWSPGHAEELLTGVMYFGNSTRTADFVRRWIVATEEWRKRDKDTPEQKALMQVWGEECAGQNPLKFIELPSEWLWIEPEFATMYPDKQPVIAHTQASRRHKHAAVR